MTSLETAWWRPPPCQRSIRAGSCLAPGNSRETGKSNILFSSLRELALPAFSINGPERCYHCKKALFQALLSLARKKGVQHVAHGANVDDLADYRPGFKAAKEMGIMAPLVEVGIGKADVRFLAKDMGIDLWNKPSMACLASRIPYGTK